MAKPPPAPAKTTLASLRSDLDTALAADHDCDSLLLELTRGDAARIVRSNLFAVSDIAFDKGAMRVLGVPVSVGGVEVSRLVAAPEARNGDA